MVLLDTAAGRLCSPGWQEHPYLLHLGLQCYDRQFLSEYCRMPATPLMVRDGDISQTGCCHAEAGPLISYLHSTSASQVFYAGLHS